MNAAFGAVSGSFASAGSGAWAVPGLLAPESMGVGFSGMVATVTLPSPWGVISSGGTTVRAHGTQSNADTTTYTVNFAGSVPASGSRTAYLAATIQTIQQNPFPIPGPPPGHPSFNPGYTPTVGYATNTWTVGLTAVTGIPDNVNTFELFRSTLTAGQVTMSAYDTSGWRRAVARRATPILVMASGGTLTPQQAQYVISPSVSGLTHTLPATSVAGGLAFQAVNSTNGNWTIATTGADRIIGMASGAVASVVIPPSGAVTLWGNASSAVWDVIGFNTATNNFWSGTNTFLDPLSGGITVVEGGGGNGAGIKLQGSTGNKYLRARANTLEYVNSAYSAVIAIMDDVGNFTTQARLRAAFGAYNSGDVNAAAILSDFQSNKSAPGYFIFPNGVILEWGNVALASPSQADFAFPLAFPSQALGMVGSPGWNINYIGGGGTYAIGVQALSNSTYRVTNSSVTTGTMGIWWFAVGV